MTDGKSWYPMGAVHPCSATRTKPITKSIFEGIVRCEPDAQQSLTAAGKAVAMIGEIGGTDEQVAAAFVRDRMSKPVVGFIAGQTAPPGRRMGHAGAIISGSEGTAEEKTRIFRECGISVAERPVDIVALIQERL